MGSVNLRYRAGRKKPWRAQWYERIGDKLVPREKWFAGPAGEQPPPAAVKFKEAHEGEATQFEELAVTSTDRARWWRLKQDAAAAGITPEVALAAGLELLKKRARKTEPLGTALELWVLDAKDRHLRPASISTMKQAVTAFAEKRETTPVNQFTHQDLLLWVASRYTDQGSRDDVLGRLLTFFRWCASAPRAWCDKSEFTAVKWEQKVKGDKKRVGYYTASEMMAILTALVDSLKPAVALGFQMGLRPIEMMRVRFRWEHRGEVYGFDEKKGIWHIAPEWAKTRAYRKLYDIPDCWFYWWLKFKPAIKPNRRQKKRAGYLVPMNYRNFRHALSAARAAAGVKKNPHDGIRHSFGTHGFHRSRDGKSRGVEWCIANMGHVGGYRVFANSYDGKVDTDEAELYFLAYPEGAACDVKTRARIIVAT